MVKGKFKTTQQTASRYSPKVESPTSEPDGKRYVYVRFLAINQKAEVQFKNFR